MARRRTAATHLARNHLHAPADRRRHVAGVRSAEQFTGEEVGGADVDGVVGGGVVGLRVGARFGGPVSPPLPAFFPRNASPSGPAHGWMSVKATEPLGDDPLAVSEK